MKKKLPGKKLTILVIAIVVLILALLTLYLILGGRIAQNPPDTIGNTAGNLNNGGLFCEQDGKVYFSNSFDSYSLYSMDLDEGNVRRLNTLKVRNLLAGGSYLYYFQTGTVEDGTGFGQIPGAKSFGRCKRNGTGTTALAKDVVVTGQLVGNDLFLLTSTNDGPSFYTITTNSSGKTVLADYTINPACARDGVIYYVGTTQNHYLYALDTTTHVSREVWRGNLWNPVLEGDYIYYMDVANAYRLCRYSLSQNVVEVLTEDRVDCFNMGGGYIYYQKNSSEEPQLKCMRTDGSDVKVIAQGNYTHINMTSRYVYFQDFTDEVTMYHSPLGSDSYEIFYGAMPK